MLGAAARPAGMFDKPARATNAGSPRAAELRPADPLRNADLKSSRPIPASRLHVVSTSHALLAEANSAPDLKLTGKRSVCAGKMRRSSGGPAVNAVFGPYPIKSRNADPTVRRPPHVRKTIRTQEVEPSEESRSLARLT